MGWQYVNPYLLESPSLSNFHFQTSCTNPVPSRSRRSGRSIAWGHNRLRGKGRILSSCGVEAVQSKLEYHCSLQWAWALRVSRDGAGMEKAQDCQVLRQGMVRSWRWRRGDWRSPLRQDAVFLSIIQVHLFIYRLSSPIPFYIDHFLSIFISPLTSIFPHTFTFASLNIFSPTFTVQRSNSSNSLSCRWTEIHDITYAHLVGPDHDLFDLFVKSFTMHQPELRSILFLLSPYLMLFISLLWLGPVLVNHEFQQQGRGSPLFPFPPTLKENKSYINGVHRSRFLLQPPAVGVSGDGAGMEKIAESYHQE